MGDDAVDSDQPSLPVFGRVGGQPLQRVLRDYQPNEIRARVVCKEHHVVLAVVTKASAVARSKVVTRTSEVDLTAKDAISAKCEGCLADGRGIWSLFPQKVLTLLKARGATKGSIDIEDVAEEWAPGTVGRRLRARLLRRPRSPYPPDDD